MQEPNVDEFIISANECVCRKFFLVLQAIQNKQFTKTVINWQNVRAKVIVPCAIQMASAGLSFVVALQANLMDGFLPNYQVMLSMQTCRQGFLPALSIFFTRNPCILPWRVPMFHDDNVNVCSLEKFSDVFKRFCSICTEVGVSALLPISVIESVCAFQEVVDFISC